MEKLLKSQNCQTKDQIIKNLEMNGLSANKINILYGVTAYITPLNAIMNFHGIPLACWGSAISCLQKQDVMGLLYLAHLMDSSAMLKFVEFNKVLFEKIDIYENALLKSYTCTDINYHTVPTEKIKKLFFQTNREKLFAAGNPLPEKKDSYTLYRGVSRTGDSRKERGLSWTSSYKIALWFAKRFGGEMQAVYMAEVPLKDIFAYWNHINEEEYLCDISSDIDLIEVWRDDSGEYKPMKHPVSKKAILLEDSVLNQI